MLKVTFKGHLDTGGSSDRAYMEFEDPDGIVYATAGDKTTDNTTVERGSNRNGRTIID